MSWLEGVLRGGREGGKRSEFVVHVDVGVGCMCYVSNNHLRLLLLTVLTASYHHSLCVVPSIHPSILWCFYYLLSQHLFSHLTSLSLPPLLPYYTSIFHFSLFFDLFSFTSFSFLFSFIDIYRHAIVQLQLLVTTNNHLEIAYKKGNNKTKGTKELKDIKRITKNIPKNVSKNLSKSKKKSKRTKNDSDSDNNNDNDDNDINENVRYDDDGNEVGGRIERIERRYVWIYMHICIYVHICMHMCICMHTCVYVYIYEYLYKYVHVFLHMYRLACINMYAYVYN